MALGPRCTTASLLLLVPVLLNAALCAITWWVRRSFTIHAAPSTTSTLLRRWLLLMVGARRAVLVLGFLTSDSFIPFSALASGDDLIGRAQRDSPAGLPRLHPRAAAHGDGLDLRAVPRSDDSLGRGARPVGAPRRLGRHPRPRAARAARSASYARCPRRSTSLTPLLRAHGAGTLGWMQTWEGNQVWVSPFDEAGVAYRGPAASR